MLDANEYEVANGAIRDAVGLFRKRYPWADAEDMKQEAWVEVVRTAGKNQFDPARGDLRAYFYSIAKYALLPFVWRQRAVLSASRSELAKLFEVKVASLDLLYEMSADVPDPATEIDAAGWLGDVRDRLAKIFSGIDGGDIAEACIVHDQKAHTVAAAFGVPVADVYSVTRKARRAVSRDCELFSLWRRDERNEN